MPEKQKVITFGVPESQYNKINAFASNRGKKVSEFMKDFVNNYFDFADDMFTKKVILAVPKDKMGDKSYLKAWFKQKTDYLIDKFYQQYHNPQSPHNTPTAHEEYE